MIFTLCLFMVATLIIMYIEESNWKERRMIKQLINQHKANKYRRPLYRSKYYCGYFPKKNRRHIR